MAYIGNSRRNGFYCPLLTQKNNCRDERRTCVGIEIKNKKIGIETPTRIEKCKEKLLKSCNTEIAEIVIKEIEEILEILEKKGR